MAPDATQQRTAAATGPDVVAAGAVVLRKGGDVLLVHRPKYDDWAFPKGKQDPGEHVVSTAVREVLEETGVEIRLGRPLPPQLYAISGGRAKMVHYWVGRVMGDCDVSGYVVNSEIDEVVWVPREKARRMLTYEDDVELLGRLEERRNKTSALVVLRHGQARKRSQWAGPDGARPLTPVGKAQARALDAALAAYGVTRVLTSDSLRCTQTVSTYARTHVLPVEERTALSEEGANAPSLGHIVKELLGQRESVVICSHRPVLPVIFEHLGIEEEPLAPGELVVCHHRKGEIVAVERHLVR